MEGGRAKVKNGGEYHSLAHSIDLSSGKDFYAKRTFANLLFKQLV